MIWLNVNIESVRVGSKIRLRPFKGEYLTDAGTRKRIPQLWISGSKQIREAYPVGTYFKADLQLVRPERSGDYLKIRTGHQLQPDLAYFEHNLKLQKDAGSNRALETG